MEVQLGDVEISITMAENGYVVDVSYDEESTRYLVLMREEDEAPRALPSGPSRLAELLRELLEARESVRLAQQAE